MHHCDYDWGRAIKTTLAARIKARILHEYMDKPFTIDMLVADLKEGDNRRPFSSYICSLADKSMGKIKAVGKYRDPTEKRLGGSPKRLFVVVDRAFFENSDIGLSPRARYLKKVKDDDDAMQALIASSLALQRFSLGFRVAIPKKKRGGKVHA